MPCSPPELANGKIIKYLRRDIHLVELPNGQQYVRKVFPESHDFITHTCLAEMDILNMLQGLPNIVQFKGLCLENGRKYLFFNERLQNVSLFMEKCYGNIFDYRPIDHNPRLTVVKLLQDMARALYICEQCNIVHHDIKPENILVKNRTTFVLADFDYSGMTNFLQYSGTKGYVAPEIVCPKAQRDSRAQDYFSLGITAYAYMMRSSPINHDGKSLCQTYRQLYGPGLDEDLQNGRARGGIDVSAIKGWVDELTYEIIQTLCSYNPKSRYSPSRILRMYGLPLPDLSSVNDKYPPVGDYFYRKKTIIQYMASEICNRYLAKVKGNIDDLYVPAWHLARLRVGEHVVPMEFRAKILDILRVLDYRVYNPRLTPRLQYMSN